MREQFALALPKHLSADRFVRIATTALMRVKNLDQCTPESFMKCLLDLSSYGIEPDGRRAHLIPFKNNRAGTYECTLILDWKGLAELALRSGMIAKLHADLVCENDDFAFDCGDILHHRIDFRKDRGEPYAAYAMAITKTGEKFVQVMTRAEIERIRNNSQGYKSAAQYGKDSPWTTDPGEMWKKTAFRRLAKWLPLSAEFRDAIDKEDDETPIVREIPAANVPLFQDNSTTASGLSLELGGSSDGKDTAPASVKQSGQATNQKAKEAPPLTLDANPPSLVEEVKARVQSSGFAWDRVASLAAKGGLLIEPTIQIHLQHEDGLRDILSSWPQLLEELNKEGK